mgnify:CR=1 FL=1
MPSLHLILTSNNQDVELPQSIRAKHLHLKYVNVNLSAAAAADNVGLEVSVPFLSHYNQISSSYGRSNIAVPLSLDVKSNLVHSNVVYSGASIPSKFRVKLLNPTNGTLWTDSGGATIASVHVVLEYST